MIEIISKDEPEKTVSNKEETVFLPKNIRQVGSPRGRHRIYLEDYVYTYLRSTSKNSEACAGVFLGKSRVVKDIRYTFISGVVECSAAVFQWENISLDESFWDYIYKEQKQYFSELEIVGWVLGKAGQAMELTPAVEAAHRKYFAGRDKMLMLIDILEGEELFFIYEQGYLQKREGYYIYYEKNLAMQEYMIYKREEEMRLAELKYRELEKENATEGEAMQEAGLAEEGAMQEAELADETAEDLEEISQDEENQTEEPQIKMQQWQSDQPIPKEPKTQAEEALETYRQMLLERQGKREEKQNRRFLYTASSFFLVVLCVIGITTINNYRKMQEVEDVLNVMSDSESQSATTQKKEVAQNDAGEDNPLVVENVESQIEPLDTAGQEKAGGKDGTDSVAEAGGKGTADNVAEFVDNAGAGSNAAEAGGGETAGNADPAVGSEGTGDAPGNDKNGESENDSGENSSGNSGQSADEAKQDEPQGEADGNGQGGAQQTAAVQQIGEKKYYIVQAGDTLNSICLNLYQSKDKVQDLKEINGIEDGDKILVGQKLLLP